jgi:hypothetical protein
MKMNTRTLLILWITVIVAFGLLGCSTTEFSPGPKGPSGPQGSQGDVGPQGGLGPSSENAIHIESTDVLVKVEYPLSGFSEIEVSDFFEVQIRQGEAYRVMVEAEETIAPYHEFVVRGETLHIGLNPSFTYNIESTSQRVEVTLPTLTGVRVSSHSTVTLDGFETEESLQVVVTDFSTLRGSISAGVVEVEVTNHGELILSGSASQVVGAVTEFSDADLTGLRAADIDIDSDSFSTLEQ